MDRSSLTDGELHAAADEGDASAFAVLLHRHLDLLAAATHGSADPDRARTVLGVRVMRALRGGPTPVDVRLWLADLVGVDIEDDRGLAVDRDEFEAAQEWFTPLWVDLASRWPDGRRELRLPTWARVALVALAIVAIGVAGTSALLTAGRTPDVVAQVYANPLDPGSQGAIDPTEDFESPDEDDVEDLGDLPFYDLPTDESTRPSLGPSSDGG
jgi:hypothetical protein